MIERLVAWALANRLTIYALSMLLTIGGIGVASRMPVDVLPDLTAPSVQVVVDAGGYTPTEVEQLVTIPLETTLNGAPGLRRIRSNSTTGLAVVTLEFGWTTDAAEARRAVSERLGAAAGALPDDLPPPVMAPASSVMGEIMFVALRSDTHSPMELKSVADWTVRRRLLAVPGVAEVMTIGGDERPARPASWWRMARNCWWRGSAALRRLRPSERSLSGSKAAFPCWPATLATSGSVKA